MPHLAARQRVILSGAAAGVRDPTSADSADAVNRGTTQYVPKEKSYVCLPGQPSQPSQPG
jgi:hypothetical protein